MVLEWRVWFLDGGHGSLMEGMVLRIRKNSDEKGGGGRERLQWLRTSIAFKRWIQDIKDTLGIKMYKPASR